MINVIKYRYWYFLFSLLIIVPGAIFLITGGLKAGIDFTGGTELTIRFKNVQPSTTLEDRLRAAAKNAKLDQAEVISATPFGGGTSSDARYLLRIPDIGNSEAKLAAILAPLYQEYGCGSLVKTISPGVYKAPLPPCSKVVLELRNDVGPTIGAAIRQRATIAVLIACAFILLYISFAFRKVAHPFRYGTCAIVALVHDVLVVLGLFAIFGRLLGVTVDSLFVTAVLTVIGFSVHDTIVIFDRIRENMSRRIGEPFELIVNNAILQSMARSLNTSLTVLMTLSALLIFGGASIRIFVLTLLVGITSGTYSSIFNASPLLVVWENDELGLKRIFGRRKKAPATTPRGRPSSTAAR
jgi:preprotein translocase subunit SecF